MRRGVLDIAIHGSLDEKSLKALGQRVRDEIAAVREEITELTKS